MPSAGSGGLRVVKEATRDGLTLTQAGVLAGIPIDTLVLLAKDGLLAGAVRGPGGHFRLAREDLPGRGDVLRILEEVLDQHLRAAHRAVAAISKECEAVSNDIVLALENSHLVLGDDLLNQQRIGYRNGETDLSLNVKRLYEATWRAASYQRALGRTRRARRRLPHDDAKDE